MSLCICTIDTQYLVKSSPGNDPSLSQEIESSFPLCHRLSLPCIFPRIKGTIIDTLFIEIRRASCNGAFLLQKSIFTQSLQIFTVCLPWYTHIARDWFFTGPSRAPFRTRSFSARFVHACDIHNKQAEPLASRNGNVGVEDGLRDKKAYQDQSITSNSSRGVACTRAPNKNATRVNHSFCSEISEVPGYFHEIEKSP